MGDGTAVVDSLHYSKDHEWVRLDGYVATVGITDHAQHALGDVTYVDMPPVGKQVKHGGEMAAVESAKAASDVFAPVSGSISEVNSALQDAPERINDDPYGEGWLCKISGVNDAELKNLMTAAQYREFVASESK